MSLDKDEIVDIPAKRIKYFGGQGKMLLPSTTTVEEFLRQVPPGRLVTTGILCMALSKKFEVKGTCPVTTKKALVALANDTQKRVPYWRVINQNGSLVSQFPQGIEVQAALLAEEGSTIEFVNKSARVRDFKKKLFPYSSR